MAFSHTDPQQRLGMHCSLMVRSCHFLIVWLLGVSSCLGVSAGNDAALTPSWEQAPTLVRSEVVTPAAGRLLLAGPSLRDPHFARSVILLLRHDRHSSMGIILNAPSRAKIERMLPNFDPKTQRALPLYYGGPVAATRLFALFQTEKPPPESRLVAPRIAFTSSFDTVNWVIRHGQSAPVVRIFVGYAGWGTGQLMREIKQGAWDVVDLAGADILSFPTDIWSRLRDSHFGRWVWNPHLNPGPTAHLGGTAAAVGTATKLGFLADRPIWGHDERHECPVAFPRYHLAVLSQVRVCTGFCGN